MIVFLVLLLITLYFVFKTDHLKMNGVEKKYLFLALLSKMFAALALFYIYTHYYTDQSKSDIYKYFRDGEKLASITTVSFTDYLRVISGFEPINHYSILKLDALLFWDKVNSYGFLNDNKLIIKVDSFLFLLTNGSIFYSFLILSIGSFLSMVFLLRSFTSIFSSLQSKLLFLLLFFSPTILIWTSGALKEMLLVNFLCISLGLLIRSGRKSFVILPFLSLFLMLSKPQIGAIFIFLSLIYLFVQKFKIQRVGLAYALIMFTGLTLIAVNSYVLRPGYYDLSYTTKEKHLWEKLLSKSYDENVLGNGWNILEKLKFKQLGNRHEAKREGAKSYFHLRKLDGTFSNLLVVLPEGILNTLFRPYFWEMKNPLMLIPALENIIIFVLFIGIVFFLFKRRKESIPPLIWFGIWYVLIAAAFIGILTPVLGNLVRYKVAFLPVFYLTFVLLCGDNLEAYFQKILKRSKISSS